MAGVILHLQAAVVQRLDAQRHDGSRSSAATMRNASAGDQVRRLLSRKPRNYEMLAWILTRFARLPNGSGSHWT